MGKKDALLKLKNVSKFYYNKGLVATGFTRVSLEFNLGEFVVITGESGSGKSTLLNVLSGLDSYEEGEMYINGKETSHYNDSDFEHYRKTYIGNIFQTFNLVGSYTVYQNIELVLLLNGFNKKAIHNKIIELIKEVDLYKFRNTKVSKLSGGQKQRVAIARALAKDTPIIIADEPTGNLDSKSAKGIIKLLSQIAKDKLIIVVTHNYDQLEAYATRKIEMNDGKVREDISLKEYTSQDAILNEYQDITLYNKVLLGFRNTFNIFPKFILTFIVFLFILVSFLGEYSVFKTLAMEEAKTGYNAYFSNTDINRIVINKKDKSQISQKDFEYLENLQMISRIEKADLLLDLTYSINNNEFYMWGKLGSLETVKKVDVGRLPQKANEVVVMGYEHDYYLTKTEVLFTHNLNLYDDYGRIIEYEEPLKIVGVIYNKSYNDDTMYLSKELIDKVGLISIQRQSNITLEINKNKIYIENNDNYMQLVPNANIPQGEAIFPSDVSSWCLNYDCKNEALKVTIDNIYYQRNINLKVTNTYNKDNFKSLLNLNNYDDYYSTIFVSYEDYNTLYNNTYQSSVFARKYDDLKTLSNKLEDYGFNTLIIKDTLVNYSDGVVQVINIFKIIVTVVLFIVLFFITYFVIKLIQKSKNVYYSTVRILGGSKKVIKNLISIELYTVYHLAFFSFLVLTILSNLKVLSNGFISAITKNLGISEFIAIYLILLCMSILLSWTYSRKLFKSSAMKAYKEEV